MNPFLTSIINEPMQDGLLAVAKLDQKRLEAATIESSDAEIDNLRVWTLDRIGTSHVERVLVLGGLLTLYRAATAREDRRAYFLSLLAELNVSETKGYLSIAIFRVFGKLLLKAPDLAPLLPVASMGILSAKSVSEEARDEAIEMARRGERVTMPIARSLVGSSDAPPPDVDQSPGIDEPVGEPTAYDATPAQTQPITTAARATKKTKTPPEAIWSHVGEASTICVRPATEEAASDTATLYRDLYHALGAFAEDFRDQLSDTHLEDEPCSTP